MNTSDKKILHIGTDWDDFEQEIFTPEEINASNVRVALASELIRARKDEDLSQKCLEKLSDIK